MTHEGNPGFDWHDFQRMAVRRRWWLLTPLFALGLAGAVVPHFMPSMYQSKALILVQQQQVPTQLVAPNVTTSAGEQLQSLTQQILSRPRLQNLVDSLGLYQQERSRKSMDQIVDQMAKDITTTTVTSPDRPDELTGFRIAYSASSPVLAQRVVSKLTSLFIEDNYTARAQESASTTQFFQSQLHDAQQSLQQAQDRLRAYKLQHLGALPEQEQSNLEILSSLETQYGTAADALQRAEQDKSYFESLQAQYQDTTNNPAVSDPDSPAARLRTLRLKLADLEASHTDAYPDVVSTKDEIAKLEKQVSAGGASTASAGSGAAVARGPVAIEAASRLAAINLEIKNRQKEMNDLQQRIQTMQQGMNGAPVLEQALSALTQDVTDAQKNYESLLSRDQESQLATNLEENQDGERFQVVDPASLPSAPVSPNRLLILLGGWFLGAALGAGLLVLRELFDRTIPGEHAIALLTTAPILATVPTLEPAGGGIRRWGYRVLEVTAVVTLVAAVAISVALLNL